jgi:fatty acid desaturase
VGAHICAAAGGTAGNRVGNSIIYDVAGLLAHEVIATGSRSGILSPAVVTTGIVYHIVDLVIVVFLGIIWLVAALFISGAQFLLVTIHS